MAGKGKAQAMAEEGRLDESRQNLTGGAERKWLTGPSLAPTASASRGTRLGRDGLFCRPHCKAALHPQGCCLRGGQHSVLVHHHSQKMAVTLVLSNSGC